ncbi:MAG: glycosyltransferase family 39 protein [Victivallales bacterium]|nr:glycosyltransferase family 39 protein [Victivallales bacterium]
MLRKPDLFNVHVMFVLTALLALPMLFQFTPEDDCSSRYAYMAEAFAQGDFLRAFHSRFLPLFSVLTGVVAYILPVDGFFACKFINWLCFAFSVYPLYYCVITLSGSRRTALLASSLLVFCYPLLSLIGDGNRDSVKSFLIIAAAWALVRLLASGRWTYLIWTGVITGAMTLLRGDNALYAIMIIAMVAFYEIRKNGLRKLWRPVLTGLTALLIITPWLIFQYHSIGYPVPESRHGRLLEQMSASMPWITCIKNDASRHELIDAPSLESTPAVIQNANTQTTAPVTVKNTELAESSHRSKRGYSFGNFVAKLLKGLYPFMFVLAFAGVVMRIKTRAWNKYDTVMAILFLGHILLIVLQIAIADRYLYVSSRYVQSSIPLYLCWSAAGLEYIHTLIGRYLPVRLLKLRLEWLVAAVIMVGSYQQGIKSVWSDYFGKDLPFRHQREIINIINASDLNRQYGEHTAYECHFYSAPLLVSDFNSLGYYTNLPVISWYDLQHGSSHGYKLPIAIENIAFILVRKSHQDKREWLNQRMKLEEVYHDRRYILFRNINYRQKPELK